MNNDNSNLEPVQNSAENPEVGASTPTVDVPGFQTIDPTADFQTVDPTVTEALAPSVPVANEGEPVTEELVPSEEVQSRESAATELFKSEAAKATTPTFDPAKIKPPKATPVNMSSVNVGSTRYNPVTGEEMDINHMDGNEQNAPVVDSTKKETPKEVEEKDPKKGNTIMLIFFFIFLILFVIFLPELQTLIALRKQGDKPKEVITTGTLVCTYESNTVNLDHNYTREFEFTDSKLQKATFTTIIRGDSTLDEEALDNYNAQCVQIHDNVDGMNGVIVSCDYKEGKLTEKEVFDYSIYSFEEVSAAYTEAGGNVLEFQHEQDIDQIMTNMRQSGFTCFKEK